MTRGYEPTYGAARRSAAILALGLVLGTSFPVEPSWAAATASSTRSTVNRQAQRLDRVEQNLRSLSHGLNQQAANQRNDRVKTGARLDALEKESDHILLPVTILVSILAAGGFLGIVFSFRDQRRTSQLHELAVGSETASQRRDEQTYASFLEQSQTTLALVNDTLKLAKESSDEATRGLQDKSKAKLEAIEDRAQRLMFRVFASDEFELIVEDSQHRAEVRAIGASVRALEEYLSWRQEVSLPPYSRFVKAIDDFLHDQTEEAIDALRRASQSAPSGDLHRFTLYWLGYMLTTTGEYGEALRAFHDNQLGLPQGDIEQFELKRIGLETKFFLEAKPKARQSGQDASGREEREPRERLAAVTSILGDLDQLASAIPAGTENQDARQVYLHTANEVARTRADVFAWIAWDRTRLDKPLVDSKEATPVATARRVEAALPPASYGKTDGESQQPNADPREALKESGLWNALSDADTCRAWAHLQAQAICTKCKEPSFAVLFAHAESLFMVNDRNEAEALFRLAETQVTTEFTELREQRTIASLEESSLIVRSRLLELHRGKEEQRLQEERAVHEAFRRVDAAVRTMQPGRVTLFSQIQRRNITRTEFSQEIIEILQQEGLDGAES